jgi:hypothetical protein
MPFPLEKWSRWVESSQKGDEYPSNRISEIVQHLASIRALIKRRNITSTSKIASMLLPIDRMLQQWRDQLPVSWWPQSFPSPGNSSVFFDSKFDIYPDLWIATIWNNYRSARILIHETLMTLVLAGFLACGSTTLDDSIGILSAVTLEICRSVPFHFDPSGVCGGLNTVQGKNGQEFSSCPGGYLLLWPLYMAGMLQTTSKECRKWIADQLNRVGLCLGIHLAISLSTALQHANTSFLQTEFWLYGGETGAGL